MLSHPDSAEEGEAEILAKENKIVSQVLEKSIIKLLTVLQNLRDIKMYTISKKIMLVKAAYQNSILKSIIILVSVIWKANKPELKFQLNKEYVINGK